MVLPSLVALGYDPFYWRSRLWPWRVTQRFGQQNAELYEGYRGAVVLAAEVNVENKEGR